MEISFQTKFKYNRHAISALRAIIEYELHLSQYPIVETMVTKEPEFAFTPKLDEMMDLMGWKRSKMKFMKLD